MKAVITVIGRDTVGVVAKVSAVCAELNINIEDSEGIFSYLELFG